MRDDRGFEELFEEGSVATGPARDRARARLDAVIVEERRAPGIGSRVPSTSRTRRAGAIGLVAALAAAAIVVPSLLRPTASPSAAGVLRQLAQQVGVGWESPTDGQLIYTRTLGDRWACDEAACAVLPFEREHWVAPDGSGRILERVDGAITDQTFAPGSLPFDDLSGQLGSSKPELRGFVESLVPSGVPHDDFAVFVIVADLLGETRALPEIRLRLFEVAASLDDTESLGTVQDASGRPGVGVAASDGTVSHVIVFDPESATILGRLNVAVDPGSASSTPTDAQVALGVVPGTSESYVLAGLVTSVHDRTVAAPHGSG